MGSCLPVPPGAAGEEGQNGENLQTACQHIEDQHQLGKGAVGAEITGGAHGLQTGTDVVEAGQHRGDVGGGGKTVQRDEDDADDDNDHISGQVGIGVIQNLFIYHLVVVSHHLDFPGMDDLADIAAEALEQKQHPHAFDAAAGGSRAGADDHQHQEDGLGKAGPEVKVGGGKAGGGDDAGHLKGGVAKSLLQCGIQPADVPGNQGCAAQHQSAIEPQLLVPEHGAELLYQQQRYLRDTRLLRSVQL